MNIIEGIKNKQKKKNSEQRKMKNKKKGRDELNYGKQKKLTQNDNKNNEKE